MLDFVLFSSQSTEVQVADNNRNPSSLYTAAISQENPSLCIETVKQIRSPVIPCQDLVGCAAL